MMIHENEERYLTWSRHDPMGNLINHTCLHRRHGNATVEECFRSIVIRGLWRIVVAEWLHFFLEDQCLQAWRLSEDRSFRRIASLHVTRGTNLQDTVFRSLRIWDNRSMQTTLSSYGCRSIVVAKVSQHSTPTVYNVRPFHKLTSMPTSWLWDSRRGTA